MLNIKSIIPLNNDEIKGKASSIFTSEPNIGLSSKYSFIPSSTVLEDMNKLRWECVDCAQTKSKKKMGYQKHVMVFRNPELVITGEDGDDIYPQVMISNSHDGTSTFVLRAAIFRIICENGLVIATSEFESLKIRHMGYNFEELQSSIQTILERLPQTVEFMNKMVEIKLNEQQAEQFAEAAIKLRFPGVPIKVDLKELTKPTRPQDEGSSIWTIFNIVEEKLIHGDFEYVVVESGKKRKARPIKNFQQDILLNEQLFSLAVAQLN